LFVEAMSQDKVDHQDDAAAKKEADEKIEQLRVYLSQDPNLSAEEREAEIKKARIALMRKMRVSLT